MEINVCTCVVDLLESCEMSLKKECSTRSQRDNDNDYIVFYTL